jgi:hypothetical protein
VHFMTMPHISAVVLTLGTQLVEVAEMDGLVHSDNSELLRLLQEEVGHGEGGVHTRVKHTLQQSLVTCGMELLQFHRLGGIGLTDVCVPEGPLEVPRGLRGVEGKDWSGEFLQSGWRCGWRSGRMSSNPVCSMGVDVEEAEHHPPVGGALLHCEGALLQRAG